MTDHELLEYAAKAAGIDAEFHQELGYGPEGMWLKGNRSPDNSKYWNPLTDDGDALRLAVKLCLCLDIEVRSIEVTNVQIGEDEEGIYEFVKDNGEDKNLATRRAIVRAAAEIGKAM